MLIIFSSGGTKILEAINIASHHIMLNVIISTYV